VRLGVEEHDGGMMPTQVLDALRSGNTDTISAQGDEYFRSAVSPDQMRQVWKEATARLGNLVDTGDALVLHDVPLQFTGGEAHLQVSYRGDRITGLILMPGPPTARFGQ
jgi:hypothetical protein